jgi:hypothetical protein
MRRRTILFDEAGEPVPSTSAAATGQLDGTDEEDEVDVEEVRAEPRPDDIGSMAVVAVQRCSDSASTANGQTSRGTKSDEDKTGRVRVTLQRLAPGPDQTNEDENESDEDDEREESSGRDSRADGNDPPSAGVSRESSVEMQTEG